jgi:UPF0716 family protein affecting phage T7 exclusion
VIKQVKNWILLLGVFCSVICFLLYIDTTSAWFTDSVTARIEIKAIVKEESTDTEDREVDTVAEFDDEEEVTEEITDELEDFVNEEATDDVIQEDVEEESSEEEAEEVK